MNCTHWNNYGSLCKTNLTWLLSGNCCVTMIEAKVHCNVWNCDSNINTEHYNATWETLNVNTHENLSRYANDEENRNYSATCRRALRNWRSHKRMIGELSYESWEFWVKKCARIYLIIFVRRGNSLICQYIGKRKWVPTWKIVTYAYFIYFQYFLTLDHIPRSYLYYVWVLFWSSSLNSLACRL